MLCLHKRVSHPARQGASSNPTRAAHLILRNLPEKIVRTSGEKIVIRYSQRSHSVGHNRRAPRDHSALKASIHVARYATVYLDWGSTLISAGVIAKTFLFVMFREAIRRSF